MERDNSASCFKKYLYFYRILYFMERFQGVTGIILILGLAWLVSNNKRRINYRLVFSGLFLQIIIAVLIFKVDRVKEAFQWLGRRMGDVESAARTGAEFVWGEIAVNHFDGTMGTFMTGGFVFAFNITATIILVCVLVAILYHFRIMQFVVSVIARAMNFIMRVSGAEALSNVASAFVGQVEAQVMIRPYLAGMTRSELLASMSGSLACIAGGILIVYVGMGERAGLHLAPNLIAASLMAAPGALVISKIVWPETEESQTMGRVKLDVKSNYVNVVDAIGHGASDGFKIAMNVIAMLIGFIALIAFINILAEYIIHIWNPAFGKDGVHPLDWLFGKLFTPMAWCMGVPSSDMNTVGTLLGQKLTINEFVAFKTLTAPGSQALSPKGLLIVSIAICGFANFSSVGMQIGGIGELAPERRNDLARLGMKALLCGTLASYLSASIAGILF
jgi:CNT family concentrative nucleoside transporter